jgi:hypothetical protein
VCSSCMHVRTHTCRNGRRVWRVDVCWCCVCQVHPPSLLVLCVSGQAPSIGTMSASIHHSDVRALISMSFLSNSSCFRIACTAAAPPDLLAQSIITWWSCRDTCFFQNQKKTPNEPRMMKEGIAQARYASDVPICHRYLPPTTFAVGPGRTQILLPRDRSLIYSDLRHPSSAGEKQKKKSRFPCKEHKSE